MSVVTRFAPSPTGFLHIGGARTALFNWLFARHHGGKFLLRIEDTDRERSTDEAVQTILKSLQWLGLDWDAEPTFQFQNAQRHAEIAYQLLAQGHAYYCYCTPEELHAMREEARAQNLSPRYNGAWRDRAPSDAPAGVKPTIRFKAPQIGETVLDDCVQGRVTLQNNQLDDMVLLRGDGTPTYMLSVVVDDHDMGITHIIRGDDHLTNAFRQYHLYQACGWAPPKFSHVPLIHGADGAKLSKRHGALGTDTYQELGFLPEAMCNYLLRLGWSHGDDEIISREQAISWFNMEAIGRSPARFDLQKLTHTNGIYMREADNVRLVALLLPRLEKMLNRTPSQEEQKRLYAAMDGLKQRSKTLQELAESALFYVSAPIFPHEELDRRYVTPQAAAWLAGITTHLEGADDFTPENLEKICREFAAENNLKLGPLVAPMRVALTGKTVSPSIFEVMHLLGAKETYQRLDTFRKFCETETALS